MGQTEYSSNTINQSNAVCNIYKWGRERIWLVPEHKSLVAVAWKSPALLRKHFLAPLCWVLLTFLMSQIDQYLLFPCDFQLVPWNDPFQSLSLKMPMLHSNKFPVEKKQLIFVLNSVFTHQLKWKHHLCSYSHLHSMKSARHLPKAMSIRMIWISHWANLRSIVCTAFAGLLVWWCVLWNYSRKKPATRKRIDLFERKRNGKTIGNTRNGMHTLSCSKFSKIVR